MDRPLRILFVDAIDVASDIQRSFRPLGLGYLGAMAEQKFGEDAVTMRLAFENVAETIKEFVPDIVAITSTSQNFDIARVHAANAKQAGATVLIGGYHISMMPECLSPEMDIGVLFEGEETFREILAMYLEHGHLKDPKLLQLIPGIVFRAGETLIRTAPRPFIESLDKVPSPDRALLGTEDTAIMLTSRGCPYQCVYCASTRFWRGIRFLSAEYIVREIRDLVERYHVRHIVFFDDLFIANRRRVQQLVPLIRAEKLHKRVSFNCLATASLVDDEICRLLETMNVRRVGIGLESGSEMILKQLKGAHASVEQNMNAIKTLARHGIETEGSFIIGAPDETEKDMLETVNFIRKSSLDRFDIHLLTPYPGTPLWDYALNRRLVSPTMSWERLYRDFAENPDEAIFLCEKTSRERAHEIFMELKAERDARDRRLNRKAALKAALSSPATIPSLLKRATTRISRKMSR